MRFFIAPAFAPEMVDKEVNAVDSEHKKCLDTKGLVKVHPCGNVKCMLYVYFSKYALVVCIKHVVLHIFIYMWKINRLAILYAKMQSPFQTQRSTGLLLFSNGGKLPRNMADTTWKLIHLLKSRSNPKSPAAWLQGFLGSCQVLLLPEKKVKFFFLQPNWYSITTYNSFL